MRMLNKFFFKLAKVNYKNSKPFYAYLKGKTKSRTAVGPLRGVDNNMVQSNEGMASVLNEFSPEYSPERVLSRYRMWRGWSV